MNTGQKITPEQAGKEWDEIQLAEDLVDAAELAVQEGRMSDASKFYNEISKLPNGSW